MRGQMDATMLREKARERVRLGDSLLRHRFRTASAKLPTASGLRALSSGLRAQELVGGHLTDDLR